MTSLQAIQQHMQQAVLARNAASPDTIRSDAIADVQTRLDVYRHGYRIRLRDALRNEFAGLQNMVGDRFDTLLDKYVDAHPSEHYNIRWYGAGLAAFLDYARPWRDKPQLAEMARLDWAISKAFDAADESSVGIADLAAVAPEDWAGLRLSLQENLHVLPCTFNVDAFRRAADSGNKRPRLRRHGAAVQHVMVWRKATTVHYRALDGDEWPVLAAAMRGDPFAGLCETLRARQEESAAMARMVAMLQGWLQSGLVRGWTID